MLIFATMMALQAMGGMPMPAGAMPATGKQACAAPAPLPPPFAGWNDRSALSASAKTQDAPTLTIARAVTLMLAPTGRVTFAVPLGKPAQASDTGGLAAFEIVDAGTYRIALGVPAWLDVVQGSQTVTSVGHDHGPACSGIRKTVDFRLEPGRYFLQLSGTQAQSVPVMISRVS